MNIQCDVCNKDEASMFCTADEAALCDTCDHRVHHANKLASKHQRFSLLHSSSENSPLCDVCQEKRALLFCQQDRTILCRDCDVPIHTANDHTQKHNRFLLTGVKLSATSMLYIPFSSATFGDGDLVPDLKSTRQQQLSMKKPLLASPVSSSPASVAKNVSLNAMANEGDGDNPVMNEGMGSLSSISEYLIEMLPGWHAEDFLDCPSTSFGFCKPDDAVFNFAGADLQSNFSSESLRLWFPQAQISANPTQYYPHVVELSGFKETMEGTNMKANRRQADDVFTVPQISPSPTTSSNRYRPFW